MEIENILIRLILRLELAARSGSELLVFSAAAGTGVVFLSPRRSEGCSAPGSGADYPSGGGGAWI